MQLSHTSEINVASHGQLSVDSTNCKDLSSAVNDLDAASMCSSPSSVKVRLRNTFLDFREDTAGPDLLTNELGCSPRADSVSGADINAAVMSPLRRSQSDCTGVDQYIRHRLGSNAGVPIDTVEIDSDAGFSPQGRLSPMSKLVEQHMQEGPGVSILSFSPPTFQAGAFPLHREVNNSTSDFVMVMEEDPPLSYSRPLSNTSVTMISSTSTQPGTPHQLAPAIIGFTSYNQHAVDQSESKTTVMLRNIPNKYTQRMLLDQINGMGYEGMYDFFYLPIDFRNRCNVGYAFINFLSNEMAVQFKKHLDGYQLTGFNSQKICEVSYARVQGLRANIQHYRNSPVNGIAIPEYRPLLFSNGQEIPFPLVARTGHPYS